MRHGNASRRAAALTHRFSCRSRPPAQTCGTAARGAGASGRRAALRGPLTSGSHPPQLEAAALQARPQGARSARASPPIARAACASHHSYSAGAGGGVQLPGTDVGQAASAPRKRLCSRSMAQRRDAHLLHPGSCVRSKQRHPEAGCGCACGGPVVVGTECGHCWFSRAPSSVGDMGSPQGWPGQAALAAAACTAAAAAACASTPAAWPCCAASSAAATPATHAPLAAPHGCAMAAPRHAARAAAREAQGRTVQFKCRTQMYDCVARCDRQDGCADARHGAAQSARRVHGAWRISPRRARGAAVSPPRPAAPAAARPTPSPGRPWRS